MTRLGASLCRRSFLRCVVLKAHWRFQYDTQILGFSGTTGVPLLSGFDGDGIMDILVSDNDEWDLYGIAFESDWAGSQQR